MDNMNEKRYWLKPPLTWGTFPSPRHSMITWTTEDRYMYIWGGIIECPEPHEGNSVYRLDTVSNTWATITTSGYPPPLNFRSPSWAIFGDGKIFSVVFTWDNDTTGDLLQQPITCTCHILDTSNWTWTTENTAYTISPYHINGCCTTYIDGEIYFLFGLSLKNNKERQAVNNISKLDTKTWKWSNVTTNCTPCGLTSISCVSIGKKIIISGGYYLSFNLGSPIFVTHKYYILNLEGGGNPSWHETSLALRTDEFDGGREGHVLIFPGQSRLYAMKQLQQQQQQQGETKTINIPNIDIEDPKSTLSWTNKIISIGGFFSVASIQVKYTNSFIFDFSQKRDIKIENDNLSVPYERRYHGAQVVGTKLYTFGGKWKDQIFNDINVLQLLDEDLPEELPSKKIRLKCITYESNKSTENNSQQQQEEQQQASTIPKLPDIGEYATSLEKAFNNKEYFPDVKFFHNGKKIYAHKIVLYISSPSFHKRFDEQAKLLASKRPSKKPNNNGDDKGKEKDTDMGDEEYSIWAGDTFMERISVPEYWNEGLFKRIIQFMYTGILIINSKEEAKAIGEMAYEYLMDPIMKFCNSTLKFPSTYTVPQEQMLKRYRKLIGKIVGSDISFVFNKSHRLFSHKFLLYTFCQHFKDILTNNKKLKYIEVKEGISHKEFISYLRVVYSNYHPCSLSRVDLGGALNVAINYKDKNLELLIANEPNVFTPENSGGIYTISKRNNLDHLASRAEIYILTHFDKSVRSNSTKNWDSDFIKRIAEVLSGDFDDWCHFSSWLDVLWFAHHTENTKLKAKAVEKLDSLVNLENVIPIMVAAHTAEEKALRSKCIDMLIEHGPYADKVKRIQAHAEEDLKRVGGKLSQSMRIEISKKLQDRVSNLHTDIHLPKPKMKITLFNKRKRTCAVCKRIVDPEELKMDVILPEVFFGEPKPRQVCISCVSLAALIPS